MPLTIKRPKDFTVDEVNARIPLLSSILRNVVELSEQLKRLHERLILLQTDGAQDPGEDREIARLSAELDARQAELRGYAGEIAQLGGVLKDDFLGLVDFPARIDGRDVCLCYRYGETEIAFYHDVDAGYSGRRPLPHIRSRGAR
jgi:hypothetical protein